jgi:hypothetical protein
MLGLIGASGLVLGSLGGAGATAVFGGRQARAERRRQAYEPFIGALDQLDIIWVASVIPDRDTAAKQRGPETRQAAEGIQQVFPKVQLAGPRRAASAAQPPRPAVLLHDHGTFSAIIADQVP